MGSGSDCKRESITWDNSGWNCGCWSCLVVLSQEKKK